MVGRRGDRHDGQIGSSPCASRMISMNASAVPALLRLGKISGDDLQQDSHWPAAARRSQAPAHISFSGTSSGKLRARPLVDQPWSPIHAASARCNRSSLQSIVTAAQSRGMAALEIQIPAVHRTRFEPGELVRWIVMAPPSQELSLSTKPCEFNTDDREYRCGEAAHSTGAPFGLDRRGRGVQPRLGANR